MHFAYLTTIGHLSSNNLMARVIPSSTPLTSSKPAIMLKLK